ncbi:MAG: YheT family hydrolase [Bdellovibrionota bacterium]|jgi:predicted alpha/beta-fold hydrolase
MPIVSSSSFSTHIKNGYIQTILPPFFYKSEKHPVQYYRRRILTPDQDFLDLDWLCGGNSRAIIITHALEGSSQSWYVKQAAKQLLSAGWDVLAWNLRSCSTELNKCPTWYHAGSVEDLARVFSHALFTKRYQEICMLGFGFGGVITLNFLGSHSHEIAQLVNRTVVCSVPCDLESYMQKTTSWRNNIFYTGILRSLKNKIRKKTVLFPEVFKDIDLNKIRNLKEFDTFCTAPLHGFNSAADYWKVCSPKRILLKIEAPTLIINALNDPFLPEICFPYEAALKSNFIHLETPLTGGHLGFYTNFLKTNWFISRALEFLEPFAGITADTPLENPSSGTSTPKERLQRAVGE